MLLAPWFGAGETSDLQNWEVAIYVAYAIKFVAIYYGGHRKLIMYFRMRLKREGILIFWKFKKHYLINLAKTWKIGEDKINNTFYIYI